MGICKICKTQINDKYETCYGCLEVYKKQKHSHLETFICIGCGINMHSIKWPGHLCCTCYSYKQKREKKKGIA